MLWCWGVRWLRGVSSTLEAELRLPLAEASVLPPADPVFRLFLVSFAGASAAVGGEAGKDNGLTHFPGLVLGVGVLGITPGDIFHSPCPILAGSDPW